MTKKNNKELKTVYLRIEALSTKQAKSPNLPVDVFIQEVENLYLWCQHDKQKLLACGMDWNMVDDLPLLSKALIQAEAQWHTVRFSPTEKEKQWNEKFPFAVSLHGRLLHDFHFAYRNEPDLIKHIGTSVETGGYAAVIQGLNDLSVFGRANRRPLQESNFPMQQLDIASRTSSEMAALLAQKTSARKAAKKAHVVRNKIYTLLKQAVDEIRVCGQYVFSYDASRYVGYVSHYARRYNKKRKQKPAVRTIKAKNDKKS
jgi:hypothetical protein